MMITIMHVQKERIKTIDVVITVTYMMITIMHVQKLKVKQTQM